MRKHLVAGALVVAMAFGALAAAGCSGAAPAEDVNANVPAGAPPLMPATHQDRFETLGASGCYGCHGASERSNPMPVSYTHLDVYKRQMMLNVPLALPEREPTTPPRARRILSRSGAGTML